jgi:hypothetical protein
VAYSIDTSALLDAWVRHYPPDVFPGIWDQMDRAAKSAILSVSDEVVNELAKKDDGAHKWVKARSSIIVALNAEIEKHVQEIMHATRAW